MPTNVIDRVAKLIARGARPLSDTDHEARNAAIEACRLIHKHSLAVVETVAVGGSASSEASRVVASSAPLDFLRELLHHFAHGAQIGAEASVKVAQAVRTARDVGRELAGDQAESTAGFAHLGARGGVREDRETFYAIYARHGARGKYVEGYTRQREAEQHARKFAETRDKSHAVYLEETDGRGEYRELLVVVPVA